MVDVFRHGTGFWKSLPAYLVHGATALLALWFVMKAVGS
jgi:hypothetical protein